MEQANRDAEERRALTHDPKLRGQIQAASYRAIYHVWPDFEVSAGINKSISTVKADAAQISFSASGSGIVWSVMDSGIDKTHQHFVKHGNIDSKSRWHRDITPDGGDPLSDENGHGTHVAGIIAVIYLSATRQRAYIVARQEARALFRLATPHRGERRRQGSGRARVF